VLSSASQTSVRSTFAKPPSTFLEIPSNVIKTKRHEHFFNPTYYIQDRISILTLEQEAKMIEKNLHKYPDEAMRRNSDPDYGHIKPSGTVMHGLDRPCMSLASAAF
jgi:hypothetical protein